MTISEDTLQQILQAQRFQSGAYKQLVENARQYAMMKTMGTYMENGKRISVGSSDRKYYEDLFLDKMKSAAENALFEDTMLGVAIQDSESC